MKSMVLDCLHAAVCLFNIRPFLCDLLNLVLLSMSLGKNKCKHFKNFLSPPPSPRCDDDPMPNDKERFAR